MKRTEASFSPNSIDSSCLRVAQTPRTRDMAIFLLTTMTTTTTRLITLPLAPARGVMKHIRIFQPSTPIRPIFCQDFFQNLRISCHKLLAALLTQGAKYSIFVRTVKNRGIFREFYARIFTSTEHTVRSILSSFPYCLFLVLHKLGEGGGGRAWCHAYHVT